MVKDTRSASCHLADHIRGRNNYGRLINDGKTSVIAMLIVTENPSPSGGGSIQAGDDMSPAIAETAKAITSRRVGSSFLILEKPSEVWTDDGRGTRRLYHHACERFKLQANSPG